MRTKHPNIIICYVPGECTGVHQPCDVGIQRLLKLSICKSYHEDVVEEFVGQLEKGVEIPTLDDRLGTLRNRSVRWMWNAFNAIDKEELVKKVRSVNIAVKKFLTMVSCRRFSRVLYGNGICRTSLLRALKPASP